MKSKLTFYEESFDLVDFTWDQEKFINPKWSRLTPEQVNELMNQ